MAGAVNVVAQTHPINSALSLVVVMGSLAVEYLLLGAEFVAAVQVIVYAGAIMVLFVFVIMLLNAGGGRAHQREPRRLVAGSSGPAAWWRADRVGSDQSFRNNGGGSWRAPGSSESDRLAAVSRFSAAF